jgi:hypothetical protein
MVAALPLRNKEPPPTPELISEGRLRVNAALAQRILTEANYIGQRPIRDHHVDDLAGQMQRGLFGAATQLYFIRQGGRFHLVNGQHRLAALIRADREIEFQIAVEDVQTVEELAAAYFRHDRLARHRSTSEVLNAVGIGERFGLSAGMAKAVFNATPLLARRFERPNYQRDPLIRDDAARLAVAQPWWPIAADYERLISDATRTGKKKLLNPQVAAVAIVTLKHQPERAAPFWKGIADNDGLRKGDPRHTFIINDRVVTSINPVLAAITSVAWNAWFEGRNINSIRVFEYSPITIKGTPYTGRGA